MSVEDLSQEEIEQRAASLGHVPKDQFRGDPDRWIDAEAFLRRGEQELPLARANNDRLHQEIKTMKETFEEFKEFQTSAMRKAEERGYEQAKRELQAKQRAAVDNADTEAYDRVTQEIDQLDKDFKPYDPPKKDPQSQSDPIFDGFVAQNQWYNNDMELKVLADSMGNYVAQTKPHLVGADFYAEVANQVKTMRPDKFTNPNRYEDSSVDEGGFRPSGNGKKKTYNNLPKEAQAACDRFIAQGWVKDRDEYLANYDWSES